MSQNKRKILQSVMPLAELISLHDNDNISIESIKFTVGRGLKNNKTLTNLSVSRNHCVFLKNEDSGMWTLQDISATGLLVNGSQIPKNIFIEIKNKDIIVFACLEEFTYKFVVVEPHKKRKYSDVIKLIQSENNISAEINHSLADSCLMQNTQNKLLDELKLDKENLLKQLEEKELEIKHIQLELSKKTIIIDENEDIIKQLKTEKESLKKKTSCHLSTTQLNDIVDSELQCTICGDVLVNATTLNCSHTFCKFCLHQWKNTKKTCPICREKITCEVHSLILDNFIDKTFENVSEELKNKRQDVKEERSVQELLTVGPRAKKFRTGVRRVSQAVRHRRNGFPRRHSGPVIVLDNSEQPSNIEAITLSSDLSSDDTSDLDSDMISVSSIDTDDDMSSYSSDDTDTPQATRRGEYVEGLPGYRYGGYGYCYVCGAEGHWAPGCPEQ